MLYYFLSTDFQTNTVPAATRFFYKGLNVFQYVTFRTAWATITALLISLLFGGKVIRKLASLKFGQEIREEVRLDITRKTGNADDGRSFDSRFGFYFDDSLGAT